MKKILLIILIPLFLTSCSQSYIQIFDTSAINSTLGNGNFVFETDTLKITYSFWASKGVMAFEVYNKIDRPIYIDWKNSSFIYNDNKLNYWVEETKTNTAGLYGGYFYKGPLLKPGYALHQGIHNSSSSTVKPEKVTFIPPKSKYYRSQFYLLPVKYYQMSPYCQTNMVKRNDHPTKETTVYSEEFAIDKSPLRFRNYLAFSFAENSSDYFFIDNGFYLHSVKEMDDRHFRGKQIGKDEAGYILYENPFLKETSFYIRINEVNSIEYKRKQSNK